MTTPPSSSQGKLKEVVPKSGILFDESSLAPVLCKPKILPHKSVTLEKLERMQKDAQAQMRLITEQEQEPPAVKDDEVGTGGGETDVWRANEDGDDEEQGSEA